MGEYVPDVDRYTALMGDAVAAAMGGEIPHIVSRPAEVVIKIAECHIVAKKLLDEVAWEESGLPNHPFRGEDEDARADNPGFLTPRQFADRLLSLAFNDAQELLKYADGFARKNGYDQDSEAGALLLRSKSLLLVARLDDRSKQYILQSMRYADFRENVSNVPQYEGEAFVMRQNKAGEEVMDWCPELKEWFTYNMIPEKGWGCPAFNYNVQTNEGGTRKLLPYFWERLIQHAYTETPS